MNFYEILGLEPSASIEEIRKAYRKYAKKYHPDKNNGDKIFEEKFKEISAAYEFLSNGEKKAEYDKQFQKQHEFFQDNFTSGKKYDSANQNTQTQNTTSHTDAQKTDRIAEKRNKNIVIGLVVLGIMIAIGMFNFDNSPFVPIFVICFLVLLRQIFAVVISYMKD